MLRSKLDQTATRLARKAGRMQRAAAPPAPRASGGIGEVAIIGEQQLVEGGVGQHG